MTLTLAGPRGPLAARFVRAATKAGRALRIASPLQAVGSGSAPSLAALPALRPGDAIAQSSVWGDVSAYAIGTVSYVDGSSVYAFGHPANGTGPARARLERARISTVIDSPTIGEQASYKLGSPIGPIGVIGFDGAYGVTGTLGVAAPGIPVTATLRDGAGTVLGQRAVQVADERSVRGAATATLLPLGAGALAGTAIQDRTNQPTVGGSARTCTTVTLRPPHGTLRSCRDTTVSGPTGQGGVESGSAEAAATAVAPVVSAERFLGLVDRVSVEETLRPEADAAEVVGMRVVGRPRAGAVAKVDVTLLQESTGGKRVVTVPVRIPKDAAGRRTGIVITADPVEEGEGEVASDDLGVIFEGEADDADASSAVAPPKNLTALRRLYTTAGISGLRAVAVAGIEGRTARGLLAGDDDVDDGDADLLLLTRRARLVSELPTVVLSGSTSATITPRR